MLTFLRRSSKKERCRENVSGITSNQISKDARHNKNVDTPLQPDIVTAKKQTERILGFSASLVIPSLERVYKITINYPASVRHHESYPGGLWVHSFRVACRCHENIQRYSLDKDHRAMAFLSGLLHDIGKAAFYVLDTKGYDFNPLLLKPNPYAVLGKGNEVGREHAFISALLIYPFLDESILSFKPGYLSELVEAIALHHASDYTPNNPLLLCLRDSDSEDVEEHIAAVTGPANTEADMNQSVLQQKTEIESKSLTDIWKECLRHKSLNEWQENYSFFIFKKAGIVAVVNPKWFVDVNRLFYERIGKELDDSIIITMLEKNKLLALKSYDGKQFVYVTVAREGGKELKLSCICLFIESMFSAGEIERFKGASAKKVGGNLVKF